MPQRIDYRIYVSYPYYTTTSSSELQLRLHSLCVCYYTAQLPIFRQQTHTFFFSAPRYVFFRAPTQHILKGAKMLPYSIFFTVQSPRHIIKLFTGIWYKIRLKHLFCNNFLASPPTQQKMTTKKISGLLWSRQKAPHLFMCNLLLVGTSSLSFNREVRPWKELKMGW